MVQRFHCGINCGSSCLLRVERDAAGRVRVRPDATAALGAADAEPARCAVPSASPDEACDSEAASKLAAADSGRTSAAGADALHGQGPCRIGLGMARWQAAPERLRYPMRRVGPRGSGAFERISWDEALDLLADRLRHTIETYGNQAIYVAYGTGAHSVIGNAHKRLLNMLGGYLGRIYDYSTHMVQASMPYLFGDDFSPYARGFSSSYTEARDHADLLLLFGDNPVETRRGPLAQGRDFSEARRAVRARGGKVIHVDCRRNGSVSADDEWIPIVPGTDAALVAALVYELLETGRADLGFLHTYCVGFDEDTMPAGYRGRNASYRAYVEGAADGVRKTPEWAARITGVPAAHIRRLADELAQARAPFISQGWGVQRHGNGEPATRAISLLPFVLGRVGLPGTNTGQRPAESPDELVPELPQGENPCKVRIPAYEWLNAVAYGSQLTARNAGVRGADRLDCGIKFLWNYAGNCLANQHGDVNCAHAVLADESKCEFIVTQDTVMTDSARYSDLLLPDQMSCEQLTLRMSGFSAFADEILLCAPAFEAPGECRRSYEVMADLAERFGLRDRFTEGRTGDEWIAYLYARARQARPELPTWDDLLQTGSYRVPIAPEVGLAGFVADPVANPLRTPSGKVEIFSARLAKLSEEWELPDGQHIAAVPVYEPEVDRRTELVGAGAPSSGTDLEDSAASPEKTDRFPLRCIGWHDRARVHSSFGFADAGGDGAAPARHRLWVNPTDAQPRGISTGDTVQVESAAGTVRMIARVTDDIVAGTVGMPQGAWYRAAGTDGSGRSDAGSPSCMQPPIDAGGCINTLTSYRPTPLAKGNGSANSARVQLRRVP